MAEPKKPSLNREEMLKYGGAEKKLGGTPAKFNKDRLIEQTPTKPMDLDEFVKGTGKGAR